LKEKDEPKFVKLEQYSFLREAMDKELDRLEAMRII
jgi:hypothetical protein